MFVVSIHVPARGTTSMLSPQEKEVLVSIHVPARGTTVTLLRFRRFYMVSIHVPARGTTLEMESRMTVQFRFQSTFPHGERRWGRFV